MDGRAIQNLELSRSERILVYDPNQGSAVAPTAQPTQPAPTAQPEKPTQIPEPTKQAQITQPEQPTQQATQVATSQPEQVTPEPTQQPPEQPQTTEALCEVVSVTPEMGYEPYYAKYCDYEGLIITASDQVSDAALERVAEILSNMFGNRPDIIEALVNSNFRLVVIAEHETIHGIPELAYLLEQEGYQGYERILSKIFDEPRFGVAPEENLLCAVTDIDYGQISFIATLANLTRYELITNLGFDGSLVNNAREQAIAEGIWNGDWVTETNGNYWDYGVQAYFNSAYDSLISGPIDDYTNTREELASYDPRLYDLIDSVFQAPEWSPTCP